MHCIDLKLTVLIFSLEFYCLVLYHVVLYFTFCVQYIDIYIYIYMKSTYTVSYKSISYMMEFAVGFEGLWLACMGADPLFCVKSCANTGWSGTTTT